MSAPSRIVGGVGETIIMRFPKPHPPQEQDPHWYPATVVRVYKASGADEELLSAAVFVDFVANPPRPQKGIHVRSGALPGPVLTCMDIRPFDLEKPELGGWAWPEEHEALGGR